MATPLRFVAYAAFAIMMIMLYYDIGRRASTVINNANMFFGMCCIVMFQSILPTVIVCEYEESLMKTISSEEIARPKRQPNYCGLSVKTSKFI